MKRKKWMKTAAMTLSVWLLILTAFSAWGPVLTPEAALAEGDFTYTLRSGQAQVVSYKGTSQEVIIPLRLGGAVVTKLHYALFEDKEITSVFIPATVEQIGSGTLPEGTVIYGEKGSYAEQYAARYGYRFKSSYVYYPKTVSISKSTATLPIPKQLKLSAKVGPETTPYVDITWSSSNPKVASVDSSGLVTPLKAGTVSIFATAKNGVRARCVITVPQPVTKVKVSLSSVVIGKGEKVSVSASLYPTDAADKTVRWSSSDTSVVKVTNGQIQGLKEGTASVTAASVNGPSAVCQVTVRSAPSKVTMRSKTLYIGIGETLTLGSDVSVGAASYSLSYGSSDPKRLKVTTSNRKATLTGLAKGSVSVTVRTYNGKTDTCRVVVMSAPTQIRFGTNKITLSVGEKYTLNTFLSDGAASVRTFSSENPSVAAFTPNNPNGELVAKKPGTVKVCVSTYNGKKAYCTVTVVQYSLRKHLVDTALQFVGLHEGDGSHHKVIDIYNTLDPLPVGYRVQYTDDWCATYVSAMSVEAGLTHIVYPECGVERMISLYKQANCWVEDDAYVPQRGDLIFFSWHNNVIGDCQTPASHVAIVADVNNGFITTVEGCIGPNQLYDARVGQRVFAVNDQEIRGFATPAYPE